MSIEEAREVARTRFGYKSLRAEQESAMEGVLDGQDTLVVAATAFGKSACWHIPAAMIDGVVLVFQPLIALMEDHVRKLKHWGLNAVRISSDVDDVAAARSIRLMRAGACQLVYAAPEQVKSSAFLRAMSVAPISLVVMDEAHMLSLSMRDWRPAYATLGEVLRTKLAHVPRLVLTATADREVERDIARVLGLKEYKRIVVSPLRKNLTYEVLHGLDHSALVQYIRQSGLLNQPGKIVVYAATRREVSTLADLIQRSGIACSAYHAGMNGEKRTEIQKAFTAGEYKILVSTNAFGMGVDIPDIRMVLHADPPGSIHDYVQESGRAGRDGKPAKCVLNVTESGLRSRKFFIKAANPALKFYEALWEVLAKHEVREAFVVNSFDLTGAVCSAGCSSFDAPYHIDSILAYLEYNGAVTTIPDKTVYTFNVVNAGRVGYWRSRFPRSVRIKGKRATVTIHPNQDDFTGGMLADRCVSPVDRYRPIKHYRILRRREHHGVTEQELSEKMEAAESRLNLLLRFVNAENKENVIRGVFLDAATRPIEDKC